MTCSKVNECPLQEDRMFKILLICKYRVQTMGYMPSFSFLASLLFVGRLFSVFLMEYFLMCFLSLVQKNRTLLFKNVEINCFETSAFLSY